MKVALVQYNPQWENKESNKEQLIILLDSMDNKTSIIVFPELTLTGFTMRSSRFAENLNGESMKYFSTLALRYNAHIFAGLIEQTGRNIYNTLVHLDDRGKLVTKYHKIHPFSFTGENRHYTAGKKPVITIINDIKIGLTICYDLRFPELYRFYGKERVHVIINIANWPVKRIEHWKALLQARAIENQCYVIGVNRVGFDKANQYSGCSCVYHPFGKEIYCLDDQTGIEIIDIFKDEVNNIRSTYPFLDDIAMI